jgi:hypothetical protein
VDTKPISQPFRVKARTGTRQRIGLNRKLINRVEVFLIKIIIKTRNFGSGARMLANSSRAEISPERRLIRLAGAAKPDTIPTPNKAIAIMSHVL